MGWEGDGDLLSSPLRSERQRLTAQRLSGDAQCTRSVLTLCMRMQVRAHASELSVRRRSTSQVRDQGHEATKRATRPIASHSIAPHRIEPCHITHIPHPTKDRPVDITSVSVCRRHQPLLIDARRSWQIGRLRRGWQSCPHIIVSSGMGEYCTVERRERSVPTLCDPF